MILDEIMKYRARQLEREKAAYGLEEMQKRAEKALAERKPVSLKAALRQDTLSCICEVKKASPSKGLIRADFFVFIISHNIRTFPDRLFH